MPHVTAKPKPLTPHHVNIVGHISAEIVTNNDENAYNGSAPFLCGALKLKHLLLRCILFKE